MLVFDKDFNKVDGDFFPVTSVAKEDGSDKPHQPITSRSFPIYEPGYVYVYLSNDGTTPVDVYFDDFTVTHQHSKVVQMDDYYPFGLTFNSYQRENSVRNKFLYNGKERQDELGLGWYDYGARMYQADLGKFFTQDRFGEKYFSFSPYQYAGNNPLKYIDSNGDSLVIVILKGLSTGDPHLKDRSYYVDSKIADNVLGFVNEARGVYSNLSVNNIYRSFPSSQIKTNNPTAKGLSRHQGGFAIDMNGVSSLSKKDKDKVREIAAKYGLAF